MILNFTRTLRILGDTLRASVEENTLPPYHFHSTSRASILLWDINEPDSRNLILTTKILLAHYRVFLTLWAR